MQEFVQEITNTVNQSLKGVHTAMPGTIVSYDPGSGTATVKPAMKFRKPDGTTIDYPQISGVPVSISQGSGGQATVAIPIKGGDGCMIVVSEQSLDYWMYGQETPTDLPFDMSNAMCIPGLAPAANAAMQKACAENCIVITAGGATTVKVKGDEVEIEAPSVNMKSPQVKIEGSLEVGSGMTVSGGLSVEGGIEETLK